MPVQHDQPGKQITLPADIVVPTPSTRQKRLAMVLKHNNSSKSNSGEFAYFGRAIKGSNFDEIVKYLIGDTTTRTRGCARVARIVTKLKIPSELIAVQDNLKLGSKIM